MTTIDDHLNAGLTYVAVDGISIAVEVVGNSTASGPVIAWIHGLGSSSTQAFTQAARHPALTGTTSLLIDLAGHGASDKPAGWSYTLEDHARTVNRVLAKIIGQPVTLLGHSMGGTIVIACAVSFPGAVERLIVAEPSLDPGFGPLSAHIASQSEERFVEQGYAALVRATERQAARGDVAAQPFLAALRQASPVGLHRSATSLRETREPSYRKQLASLTVPKAMITGQRTPPFEPPLVDVNLQGYVVRDAGHVLMADNPDEFTSAVTRALDR